MPTVSMYRNLGGATGWHSVQAPGGYEQWHFDAADQASGRRIIAVFYDGMPLHRGCLRGYARYRRWPTRIAPPLPAGFRGLALSVYHHGRIEQQSVIRVSPETFAAENDLHRVRIGDSTLCVESDRATRLTISAPLTRRTWRGYIPDPSRKMSGELFFFGPRLGHSTLEHRLLPRSVAGADHRWIPAGTLCEVKGTIGVAGSGGGEHAFDGNGYHDQQYGTSPIGWCVNRWICGRILGVDSAWTFFHAIVEGTRHPPVTHLIHVSSGGTQVYNGARLAETGGRRTLMGRVYPRQMRIGVIRHAAGGGEDSEFLLDCPRVIDIAGDAGGAFLSSRMGLRVLYRARLPGGRAAEAMCDIVYPRKLS